MHHAHHAAFESLWVSVPLILVALVYVRGWVRIRRINLETIENWRVGSFLSGLFLIWLAMASPIAALDHELLTIHMVQHLLLMTLAPPLIWLGAPLKPLLHGLTQGLGNVMSHVFRSPPVQRLGRAIAHPAVCWLAAAATLVGWHVPSLFALGMRSGLWHTTEQVSFLASGLLFWWPVIKPGQGASSGSEWPILLYLFAATLPCDILSGFLVFCDRVVYPVFSSSPQSFGLSALEDQQCAGALMWTCVTVVYLIAAAIVAARLLSPHRLEERSILQFEPKGSAVRMDPQEMEVV
jgi:cytochrome c oxidase assembly factor CtaG